MSEILYRVCCDLGKFKGCGPPIPQASAQSWADLFNAEYGRGTHWIKPVIDDAGHFVPAANVGALAGVEGEPSQ